MGILTRVAPIAPTPNTITAKRILDVTLALIALVPLTPLFLLIALVIKLDDRGPVFFRQPRIGYHNLIFTMWKFRTMCHDCTDRWGSQLTKHDDPRVTRIGMWLRKWSIDELPQVFNVLIGNMSFVGPRPHALQAKAGDKLYQDVVPGYFKRHTVLPGITGWAQVNGWRGETLIPYQIQQRVRYDIEYIARQSVWFDLRIIMLTFKCLAGRKVF